MMLAPRYKSAQLSAHLLNHSDKILIGFVIGQFNVTAVWACDCKEGGMSSKIGNCSFIFIYIKHISYVYWLWLKYIGLGY